MPPRAAPALVLLLLLSSLVGCIGAPDDAEAASVEPALNRTNATNPELPDGRGESAGLKETNVTEEGVGGVEHKHDYWKGKEQVVLLDRTVSLFCPPCMPDGEGTQPKSVEYVKLGRLPDDSGDALVYEGADRVTVLFGEPTLPGGQADPMPPGLFLQYRSAADADWREPMAVTPGTPLEIEVTPQMSDMPHSISSLWVFRITTDRPAWIEIPMTVTVHKGRDVVDWPGHPDFYADRSMRVVMDQHVTTHMSGLESFALYDSGGTWAYPEKLISWGTKQLHVFINITDVKNAYGASATGHFLEVINATVIGPEETFGERYRDRDKPEDLKSWDFYVPVDDFGMDGPYQPSSRWGFRAMATFADVQGVVGLCPGCFPYDIEYHITVIALDHEEVKIE